MDPCAADLFRKWHCTNTTLLGHYHDRLKFEIRGNGEVLL